MHKHIPFRLGEVASGEPHLYCGYTPPRWAPRAYLLLAALWQGLTALRHRLRRTAAQPAPEAPFAPPITPVASQQTEPVRRAA